MKYLPLLLLAGCGVTQVPEPPYRMILENVRTIEYLDNGRIRVTFDNDAELEYGPQEPDVI